MLDNSSPVALYEQLKLLIKDDILNGVYKSGDQLPNEKQLCSQYSVSRITVRRALKELSKEGLVEVRQGKGTFVSREKLNIKILDLGGYTNSLSGEHHHIEMKILEKKVVDATAEISKVFNVKEKSKVLKLKRLIIDEGEPLSIDIAYFPINIYPDISEKIHDDVSTFGIMKRDYEVVMAKAYKEFSVVIAQDEYSKLLNSTPNESLFCTKKIIYDIDNRPIHYSIYYILAHKVKYFINVDIFSKED